MSNTHNAPASNSNSIVDHVVANAEQVAASAQSAASDLIHNSVDSLRSSARQIARSGREANDYAQDYIKHEPVKAMLIAAATGAALMALVGLLRQSSPRG